MGESKPLYDLVRKLQGVIEEGMLDKKVIDNSVRELIALGYKAYDKGKFPPLENTYKFEGKIFNTPTNLAEALIWKLGKWKAYTSFVENYNNKELKVTKKGGVVFSAFAKHLQDNRNPIYDQHAIRAIWAICKLNKDECERCHSLLFDRSGKWKNTGSGDDGSCYELFVKYIDELSVKNDLSNEELDRLLMPLGQAIKKATKTRKHGNFNETDKDRFDLLRWSAHV